MTEAEAISLAESKFWENLSLRDRAEFQLQEKRLCMPFDVFHEAVEKTLDRPVFTHEFIDPKSLLMEMKGESPPRSIKDILALLPPEKTIVIYKQT